MPAGKDFPWFPFYTRHFTASRNVRKMTNEQVGMYLKLLIAQWEDGPFSRDMDDIAELCDCDSITLSPLWRRLSMCFVESAEGLLYNEFLEEVREEQIEKHERAVRAGKMGAEANRRKKESDAKAGL